MFSDSLFSMHAEPTGRPELPSESFVYPVWTAEQLLAQPAHQELLRELQTLLGLQQAHFEALYLSLIHRFAGFVQVLPFPDKHNLGHLLNEGLLHASVCLRTLKEMGLLHQDERLCYAVFSVALLQDVGKVQANRRVVLTDKDGRFIAKWQPLAQAGLGEVGQFYKIRFARETPRRMITYLNLLYAHHLMPAAGYDWIAEDPEVHTMWLAALADTQDSDAGTVGIVLQKTLLKRREYPVEALPLIDVQPWSPELTQGAERFWAWLKEQLKQGPVHGVERVPGGLLLAEEKIFKDFAKAISSYRDWVVVQQHFNYLGLVEKSGWDLKIKQYFSHSPQAQKLSGTHLSSQSSIFKHLPDNKANAPASQKSAQATQLSQYGFMHKNAAAVAAAVASAAYFYIPEHNLPFELPAAQYPAEKADEIEQAERSAGAYFERELILAPVQHQPFFHPDQHE